MLTTSAFKKIIRTSTILFISTCVISLIFISYLLFQSLHQLEENTKHSYESQILAEELKKSSDELTRLARTFVATGNPRFEKQFYEILNIRNGEKPRPTQNNSLYWDLAATQDHLPITVGKKKSLKDLFKEHYTEEHELELLLKSNQLSDSLIKLEELAFRAVKNRLTPEDKKYLLEGESNKEMAVRLLNDDRYHALKINIMIPIQEFITILWQRTKIKNQTLKTKIQSLKLILGFIIILILAALNSYIFKQKIDIQKTSSEIEKTQKENSDLQKISETDQLTQIANRRSLDNKLEEEWNRCKRTQSPLSLILIDIDHFKSYNDIAGHQAGDLCLKKVSSLLSICSNRAGELVARYGGEEFMIVLPNTSLEQASKIAEDARELIASAKLHSEGTKNVTISAGVACQIPDDNSLLKELIMRSDKALYNAKENGRNRVEPKTPKRQPKRALNIV